MRRIVFAPSFDREVEDIGVYIELRFGEAARRDFIEGLRDTCARIAEFPYIGRREHGYATTALAFVFRVNWVFFSVSEDEVRFLHVRDGRMDKAGQAFGA